MRSPWASLALVLAFALRLLWSFAADAVGTHLQLDAAFYQGYATLFAEGHRLLVDGEGVPTAFFPPGYPAILGTLYRVFGPDQRVAYVWNALMSTGTCALLYLIARRLYGYRTALVALWAMALWPNDVFASALTMSEVTFSFLFVGMTLLFLRWNEDDAPRVRWLIFGLLLGWVSLVRGIALPFLIVPAAVWLIQRGPSEALRRSALAGIALVAGLAPWTLRNYTQMGYPVLLSTDGPNVLFAGHSPVAFGGMSWEMRNFRKREFAELFKLPAPQREVELSRSEMALALRYMITHPVRELTLIPAKLYYFVQSDHWALSWAMRPPTSKGGQSELFGAAWDRALSHLADLFFYTLLGLSAVGIFFVVRAPSSPAIFLPLVVGYFALMQGFLFFGNPRFHHPLVPFLILLAAHAIVTLRARAGARIADAARLTAS